MTTFNLENVLVIDHQETSGDELYITFTPDDANNLPATDTLGYFPYKRYPSHSYPSDGYPDVTYEVTERTTVTVWEGDSQRPNPGGGSDTKIGSFVVMPGDTGNNMFEELKGNGAEYWVTYDIG